MVFQNEFFNSHKAEIKRSLSEWIVTLEPNIFGTIVFNEYASLDRGRWSLSRFHGRVDRELFGRYFYKVSPKKRTQFIAFPEHIDSNLHYHLLIITPANQMQRYIDSAKDVWTTMCPAGNIKLDPLKAKEDVRRTSYYSTKDFFRYENYENFIHSNEFIS